MKSETTNREVKNKLRKAIYSIPGAKKTWQTLNRVFDQKPDFTGWGMITHTFTPWHEGGGDEVAKCFLKANQLIVTEVMDGEFSLSQFKGAGNEKDVLDSLMWRHYIVYWTAWYASQSTKSTTKNLVECGVCDGLTASFAMHAVKENHEFKSYLYDAWEGMKSEYLLKAEKESSGCYSYLNIESVKNNLSKFSEQTIYNKGFIPESFENSNDPEDLVWLHIDLNAAIPTKSALEYFFDRIPAGGLILFDDYAWHGQLDTKMVVDEFFSGKAGVLLPLPTGQAVYFKR
jgi:hypothetical protein